jgi:hypothetical protein
MKTIIRNSLHTTSTSHDCLIGEIKGKKIKITYQAYNASEKCNTDFFDGDKWNHIFSILDMGVRQENSAYNIWNEEKRKKRADDLFKIAETMCAFMI